MVFAVLNLSAGSLRAEWMGYLGANVYQNFWKVGFLDNRSIINDDARVDFGKAFFIFPVVNGTATIIMDRKWVSTYSFSYARPSGDAEISSTPVISDCNGIPCRQTSGSVTDKFATTLKGLRMDHDFSVGRRLGKTGWSLFLGVKYQTFQINQDETAGTRTANYTASLLPSGPSYSNNGTSTSYLSMNYSTEALGPALGAGYTRELTSWLAINLQVSYLALFGRASMENKFRSSTDAGYFTESERTTYVGHGGSTALSFVIPFGEKILFQLTYRLQAYITKAAASAHQFKDSFGFQVNQSTDKNPSYIDNAVDLYQGFSVGVQYRVF